MLLNVPPDKRGLFHENDVESLLGMRRIIDSVFANNLAKNAQVSVSYYRGENENFSAENLIDGDPETFWATNDDTIQSSVEVAFEKEQEVNYVLLQEYIKLGQRIISFNVEAKVDGEWKEVAEGTSIGYKRILEIPSVKTKAIKINFKDARASPVVSNLEIY
ncbi:alpha-L-fucosidase [Salegentibacter salegens]|nr:alpha-L-fucosidase [Salegentibacter salegens]